MSTTTTSTTASAGTREAVLAALASYAEMTAAQVADAAGIGRSTATRTLAFLTTDGQLARTSGGRDGARRLPDRWALAATPKSMSSRARSGKRAATKTAPSTARARTSVPS